MYSAVTKGNMASLLKNITLVTRYSLLNLCVLILLSLSWFSNAEKVTVVTEISPPYQMLDEEKKLSGYSTEVVNALFQITGDKPIIKILPWARAYKTAKENKNILIYSIDRTKQREPYFYWIGSIFQERWHFWALKSEASSYSNFHDKLFSTMRGSSEHGYLSSHGYHNTHLVVSDKQRYMMVFNKRADLILETELTLKKGLSKFNLDFSLLTKVHEVKGFSPKLSLAFSINSDEALLKRYQAAFNQLVSSGELAKLQAKWQLDSQ